MERGFDCWTSRAGGPPRIWFWTELGYSSLGTPCPLWSYQSPSLLTQLWLHRSGSGPEAFWQDSRSSVSEGPAGSLVCTFYSSLLSAPPSTPWCSPPPGTLLTVGNSWWVSYLSLSLAFSAQTDQGIWREANATHLIPHFAHGFQAGRSNHIWHKLKLRNWMAFKKRNPATYQVLSRVGPHLCRGTRGVARGT